MIHWKRIGDHTLPLPRQAKPGDAGYDLAAPHDWVIHPGERATIPVGWTVAIPTGWVGLIQERSGLAMRAGLAVLGGVIDSGYRGEMAVIAVNTGEERIDIRAGDRIAQLVIVPCLHAESVEVEDLDETERGASGFGSTDAA